MGEGVGLRAWSAQEDVNRLVRFTCSVGMVLKLYECVSPEW